MENDSRRPDADAASPGGATTGAEARAALEALESDAAQLAQRLVTPWWYHLVLGALVALCIGAVAIPGVSAAVMVPFFVIGIPVLLHLYSSRYGVSTSRPAGPRSRRALLASLAVLAVLLIAAVLFAKSSLSPWWGLLPTAAAFASTVVLGRRYDALLRAEVAAPDESR